MVDHGLAEVGRARRPVASARPPWRTPCWGRGCRSSPCGRSGTRRGARGRRRDAEPGTPPRVAPLRDEHDRDEPDRHERELRSYQRPETEHDRGPEREPSTAARSIHPPPSSRGARATRRATRRSARSRGRSRRSATSARTPRARVRPRGSRSRSGVSPRWSITAPQIARARPGERSPMPASTAIHSRRNGVTMSPTVRRSTHSGLVVASTRSPALNTGP